MYLLELRRDADTYHVVVADQATRVGQGQKYEFGNSTLAFAVVVDGVMAEMNEDDRIQEVLTRARENVEMAQEMRQRDSTPEGLVGSRESQEPGPTRAGRTPKRKASSPRRIK